MKNLKLFILNIFIFATMSVFAQDFKFNTKQVPEKKTIYASDKHKPLVIINGLTVSNGIIILNNIKPEQIKSMTVFKDQQTIQKYGSDAVYGVILVETKNLSKRKLRKIIEQSTYNL